jgi:hypothetical protein
MLRVVSQEPPAARGNPFPFFPHGWPSLAFLCGWIILAALSLGKALGALGEEVLQSAYEASTETGPFSLQQSREGFQKGKSLLQAGWLNLDIDAQGETYYDTNIFGRFEDLVADFVTRVNLGILLGAGDYVQKKETYFTLTATPGGIIYWDHGDLDYFNRSLLFSGAWVREKLRVDLTGGYQKYLMGVLDLSTFALQPTPLVALPEALRLLTTHAEVMPVGLQAVYELTPRTTVALDGSYQVYNFDSGVPDIVKDSVGGTVLYQVFPKTRVGVTGRAGELDQVGNPRQEWQSVSGRMVYEYSPKLSVTATGGSAFLTTSAGVDKTIALYSLGFHYLPTEKLSFDLRGYRDFDPSLLFGSQDFIVTGGESRVGWKFSERWGAGVYGLFQNLNYFSTSAATLSPLRSARVFGAWPELNYTFKDQYKLRLFVRWSEFEVPRTVEDWQGGLSFEAFF